MDMSFDFLNHYSGLVGSQIDDSAFAKMVRKRRTDNRLGVYGLHPRQLLAFGMDNISILGFLFLLLFSTPAKPDLTVLQPDSVQPGINSSIIFYQQGANGFYGNNVTMREIYLTMSAQKAWFDYENILPGGTLRKFYFMACNYSQLDDDSTRIRLQIWRPVDLIIPSLMLVWQQLVQVPSTTKGPITYTYSINQTVALVYGDRIGWTFEGNVGPICLQYFESHLTSFYHIVNNSYPDVGSLTTFDQTFLPSQFSVAVLVDGSPVGSTAATCPTGAAGTTGSPGSSELTGHQDGDADGATGATGGTGNAGSLGAAVDQWNILAIMFLSPFIHSLSIH